MLEVRNLMVFFENALAINDVSLKVRQGEIVGVFGTSGAGKTTLMNTIAGLILDIKKKEERSGGERITILGTIRFMGEDITLIKPVRRAKKGIILSQERHPVFPDSSVEENLKIASYLGRGSERKRRFELAYTIFPHLKEIQKRKSGFLSGGEQQMLSICMALVARPNLLLMDEPLLGLSPGLQEDLVSSIEKIRDMGITVLIAEQFALPILPIIDRGYIVENGSLVLTGTGRELSENPEVRSTYLGI
jgi:branched-chain amino acid transport system ATP-binding protein